MFEALRALFSRTAAGPSFGAFGQDLASAAHSEFFGFFNLVEATRRQAQARDTVRFRPASEALGPLVWVEVAVEARRIVGLELSVRRSFIEDPQQFPFAADITASFLRAAFKDAAEMAGPADEVARFQPPFAVARVFVRDPEHAPTEHAGSSPEWAVYAGRSPHAEREAGALRLMMEAGRDGGASTLQARVTPR